MALTPTQIDYIIMMDTKAKKILRHGGEEALLMSLHDKMDKIKEIMDCASDNELDQYCEKYDGFYQTMKLLERLSLGISQGLFKDIIK